MGLLIIMRYDRPTDYSVFLRSAPLAFQKFTLGGVSDRLIQSCGFVR